jgi:hypothetical protein
MKKPKKSSHGPHGFVFISAMIRANPWPSFSLSLLLVFYIYVLCVDYAFVFFGMAVG